MPEFARFLRTHVSDGFAEEINLQAKICG